MERILRKLDTPFKRLGFIVLVVGVICSLVGIVQLGHMTSRLGRLLDYWGQALMFDRYVYRQAPFALFGPYIAAFGLLMSFLYDKTLKRLAQWISAGTPPKEKDIVLHYESSMAALEYAQKYCVTSLEDGATIPCVVESISKIEPQQWTALVLVPTDDGIKQMVAGLFGDGPHDHLKGKLCAAHSGGLVEGYGLPALLLVAELANEWHARKGWKVMRKLT